MAASETKTQPGWLDHAIAASVIGSRNGRLSESFFLFVLLTVFTKLLIQDFGL